MEEHERRQDGRETQQEARVRRPYRRPLLIEYGPVAKLTQGTNTVGTDGPGNTMRNQQCL